MAVIYLGLNVLKENTTNRHVQRVYFGIFAAREVSVY